MQDPTAAFEQIFQENPHDFTTVAHAMAQLVQTGREDLLAPWISRAVQLEPQRWETRYHQALHDELCGRFNEAIAIWTSLLATHPEIDPQGLGLARTLLANLELEQSLAVCERALQQLARSDALLSPFYDRRVYTHQFHIVASEVLLRLGDIRGCAYMLAQTQIRCPSYVMPNIPMWTQQALAGKHLLLTSSGGYGDQFLFASVIPYLRSLDCRITLTVHPDLYDIFVATLPDVRVIAEPMPTAIQQIASAALQHELNADPPDYQATTLHLPLMRAVTDSHNTLNFQPYLRIPERARIAARREITRLQKTAKGRRLVGLTWDRLQRHYPEVMGGIEAARTHRSSLPSELLNDITAASQVAEHFHFVALHEFDQHRAWPNPMPKNLSVTTIKGGDFAYTAAIIDACALIVSVDMSVANLAAMLGKETWVMLSIEGDWRWGYYRALTVGRYGKDFPSTRIRCVARCRRAGRRGTFKCSFFGRITLNPALTCS